MREETNEINVTLDVNKLLQSYSKENFMRSVFKEALTKNNQLLVNGMKDYIISEIVGSDTQAEIVAAVKQAAAAEIGKGLEVSHVFKSSMNKEISNAVQSMRTWIEEEIVKSIDKAKAKEDIAKHISDVIERKVLNSLGGICFECGDELQG